MFDRLSQLFKRAMPGSGRATMRVVVAVTGGPNAVAAPSVLPGLVPDARFELVHVETPGSNRSRDILDDAYGRVRAAGARATAKKIVATDVRTALLEASREADLLVLGTAVSPQPASEPLLVGVARRARCPVVLVRDEEEPVARTGRVLVVGERSNVGRIGFDRAVRWTGGGAGACDAVLAPSDDPFAIAERPIPNYFFLPAIALAGPLRVRALVCVRWPRTGRPRRWRRPR